MSVKSEDPPIKTKTKEEELTMLLYCVFEESGMKLSASSCEGIAATMNRLTGSRATGNGIRQKFSKLRDRVHKSGAINSDLKTPTPKKRASPTSRRKVEKEKVHHTSDESTTGSPQKFDTPMVDASPTRRLPARAKRTSISYRELNGEEDSESSPDREYVKLESDLKANYGI